MNDVILDHNEIKRNLLLAEDEERTSNLRYSLDEVRNSIKQAIQEYDHKARRLR